MALLIHQVKQQLLGSVKVEHIVVADGDDSEARSVCREMGTRYAFCEKHMGYCGAGAKDHGISLASGEYICFFDDDNAYEPFAALTLYTAAYGFDIGVAQAINNPGGFAVLPHQWSGEFEYLNIDTMNLCVRKEIAERHKWGDHQGRGTDFAWLKKLQSETIAINFVPVVIGRHL